MQVVLDLLEVGLAVVAGVQAGDFQRVLPPVRVLPGGCVGILYRDLGEVVRPSTTKVVVIYFGQLKLKPPNL